jgi:hypothetical protein
VQSSLRPALSTPEPTIARPTEVSPDAEVGICGTDREICGF